MATEVVSSTLAETANNFYFFFLILGITSKKARLERSKPDVDLIPKE